MALRVKRLNRGSADIVGRNPVFHFAVGRVGGTEFQCVLLDGKSVHATGVDQPLLKGDKVVVGDRNASVVLLLAVVLGLDFRVDSDDSSPPDAVAAVIEDIIADLYLAHSSGFVPAIGVA